MKSELRYVELFAGCGGLSLGLESCGWNLELANELSPMASETFAYNLLGVDFKAIEEEDHPVCYVKNIKKAEVSNWSHKKLAVGDVIELVKVIQDNPRLQNRFDDLDLISGGPPCQGFSMAGLRKERNPKNNLPYAFVDLVKVLQPKTVLLENVEGILRPFKSDGGIKRPWLEVAKAFASIGYAPICFLVNAKFFGIPQSRPRFILIGVRKDLEKQVLLKLRHEKATHAKSEYQYGFELANKSQQFINEFEGDQDGIKLEVIDMTKFLTNEALQEHFSLDMLYPQVEFNPHNTVKDAIHDLRSNGEFSSKGNSFKLESTRATPYSKLLSKMFSKVIAHPPYHSSGIYNHELRKHGDKIRLRFYLIQEAAKRKNGERKLLEDAIRGKKEPDDAAQKLWNTIKGSPKSRQFGINSRMDLYEKIYQIQSKKHIQRPLDQSAPAPAQVTIPDDLCHYDKDQQRVLTVREMARIQSFPDEYVFRSKVTTGGQNRKNEVPQYTQVGNAVPPLLGRAIGILLKKILE